MSLNYSSIAQLRLNLIPVQDATRPNCDNTSVQDRIDHADDDIVMDLEKYIDFSQVPSAGYTDSNFPKWLNHLSQYKSCIHMLVKLHGAKRAADEVSDIQYWEKEYDKLFEKVTKNRTEAVLPDGTNISKGQFDIKVGRTSINPVLGSGKYGQFENEGDLAQDRPRDANQSNPFTDPFNMP